MHGVFIKPMFNVPKTFFAVRHSIRRQRQVDLFEIRKINDQSIRWRFKCEKSDDDSRQTKLEQ